METGLKIIKKRNGLRYAIGEVGGKRLLEVITHIDYPEPTVRVVNGGNKTVKHFAVWISANSVTYMYYIPEGVRTIYIE